MELMSGRPRVLVVEDDADIAGVLRRSLDKEGYDVRVAGDGEEALDYLLGRGEYRHRLGGALPRLVLLDLKLPKLDGIEVLRAVRASHRAGAVPIVMLLPASEPRELAQCYQLGVNSCVQKPVHYAEFTGTLQAIGRYWLGINQPPAGVEAPVGQRAPAR